MELEQNENNPFNPFGATGSLDDDNQTVQTSNMVSSASFKGEIHIKIRSRGGKKFVTMVEGLDGNDLNLDDLAVKWRKMYTCSCAKDKKKEGAIVISGDRREDVFEYLVNNNIAKQEQIKVHGY